MAQPASPRTAVGVCPHTGWAWLVRVSGTRRNAEVEARARVVACTEFSEGALYHVAAEREGDQASFVRARRKALLERVRDTIAAHIEGVGSALVLGKEVALPPLERILAAHPLVHAAEGEMWRALFAEALTVRGIAVARAEVADVRTEMALRHEAAAIDAFLARGKKAVGTPWGREPQEAALAAWSRFS